MLLLPLLQVVLPKVKGGVFEDSAIERWYLLWRAEYIICFYKEIYHINLLICALQCLFGMTRRYVIECLSLAVGEELITILAILVWLLLPCKLCKAFLELVSQGI